MARSISWIRDWIGRIDSGGYILVCYVSNFLQEETGKHNHHGECTDLTNKDQRIDQESYTTF